VKEEANVHLTFTVKGGDLKTRWYRWALAWVGVAFTPIDHALGHSKDPELNKRLILIRGSLQETLDYLKQRGER
jgi:hypothetical protein